ncbi:hypothetical protein IJ21_17990 [Paenibacillus sp. 32O-W]|uniref:phage protein n=1 Tax=Paenibacillus sp. 32O-W TaxID=1695218 RepID=UPI000720EA77|nr:hypothetical protein [Paenibacillus sp. 32O-W]ALS27200.1 hypothetical protein IJ21_17990 [Paenibacillus sp. 32O-W]
MKQFKRKVIVEVGELTFDSAKLHIEFDVPFDDDTDPDESEIRIYNLSASSINQMKRNQKLVLKAGYEGDVGVLMEGRISYITSRMDGGDKVTRIGVIDGPDLTNIKVKNKAFKKGVRASQILSALVPLLKLPVAAFRLPKDKTYAKGYSVSGAIVDNLAQITKECGASFYVNKGRLYIRPLSVGDDTRFVLKPSTGLIKSPEFFQDDDGVKGYQVQCLLQHRITTASIIDIESKFVKGRFRARRGSHICNADEFMTSFEVVENVVR